jgi:iron complex outermembrane receptor protein
VLALAAVLGGPVRAAEPSALTEDIFLADVPVVLGATRLSQPLDESPASITVIDRQIIEASGALTIPDVLRLVPGFQVGHHLGAWSIVTYHGLSDGYSRRMQVLIDGRSVYTPAFGGVLWSDLPLAIEDIDRIEVIRGPNGVTYGANSFSAVVNIITRTPAQDNGVFVRHVRGDIETNRTVARYAGGSADFRFRVTAGHHEDNGFRSLEERDGQHTSLLNFRGDLRVGPTDSLDIQLGYAGGTRGEGEVDDESDPARERDVDSNFQQLRWRRSLGADEDLTVNLYHTYYDSSDTYPVTGTLPPPLPPVPFTSTFMEDLRSERFDLELQHTLKPARDLRLVWGAEARYDRVRGPGWFSTSEKIDSHLQRLFANAEWRFAADWIANVGAMYEHNDITGGDLSPRVAINHHFAPGQTWRASYSRAYRTPSVFEHEADTQFCASALGITQCAPLFLATTRLDPERIDATEVGYYGTFAERTLTVDLKLFRERITDIIAWPDTEAGGEEFGTFRNDGHAEIEGWETQVEWRPLPATRLILAHAYANQHGRVLFDTTPPTYFETDVSTPARTTSLLAIQKFPRGFEGSAAYYRVDSMQWVDQGEDDDTGSWKALDARLAYKLRLGRTRGSLAVVGQNLYGDYFDYRKDAVLDRRWFVHLGLETW